MLTLENKAELIAQALRMYAKNVFATSAQNLALEVLRPSIPEPVRVLYEHALGQHYLQLCKIYLPGHLGHILFPRTLLECSWDSIEETLIHQQKIGLLTSPVEPVIELLKDMAEQYSDVKRVKEIDILDAINRCTSVEELQEGLPQLVQFLRFKPEDPFPTSIEERFNLVLSKLLTNIA